MQEGSASTNSEDPLITLRRVYSSKKKVNYGDGWLLFPDDYPPVHISTKCAFRLHDSAKLMDTGSVWYMFTQTSGDKSYTKEMAEKYGFEYIGVAFRGDLCDYLVGAVDDCPGLVRSILDGTKRARRVYNPGAALSYQGPPPARTAAGGLRPAPPQGEEEEFQISAVDLQDRVRPVKDFDVLIRCPGRVVPNADLILKFAQDEYATMKKHGNQQKPQVAPLGGGKVPLYAELEDMLRANRSRLPIIIVPFNKRAPVNLLNVGDLLQSGEFQRPNEEHNKFFESTKPELVHVTRNLCSKLWQFEVLDDVKNFRKDQWLRTVAVVVDEVPWQFKGWPFQSVVDMFTSIKGFYFLERGREPPKHMVNWPITTLHLPPEQLGHRFDHIRDQFFVELEGFMKSHRVKKFVNHTTLDITQTKVERSLAIL